MRRHTLKHQLSPGQQRRRLAKIVRRKDAGHLFVPTFPREKVRRPHLTFRELSARLFSRLAAAVKPTPKPEPYDG